MTRPQLRSENKKRGLRQKFDLHLKDWLRSPLDEISKSVVAERRLALVATPLAGNRLPKCLCTVWKHVRRMHDLLQISTLATE